MREVLRFEKIAPLGRVLARTLNRESLLILALACFCELARGEGKVVVAPGGSTTVHLNPEGAEEEVVFKFGLPSVPAAKMSRENRIIRGLWVTNGIRYTQTVMVRELGLHQETPDQNTAVLLVNIHGQNTNTEYAEATAELVLELAGRRQQLELNDGLVWWVSSGKRRLLGALEIPDSGVKTASGDTLKFAGNIPPALQGSMTLKLPMEPFDSAAAEILRDIDFDAELRRLIKGGTNMLAGSGISVRLEKEPSVDRDKP